jgi:hypothetical protein
MDHASPLPRVTPDEHAGVFLALPAAARQRPQALPPRRYFQDRGATNCMRTVGKRQLKHTALNESERHDMQASVVVPAL